jgi:hypothetical protein
MAGEVLHDAVSGRQQHRHEVPAELVAALEPGKRPPVVMTVNGYQYRSTIAPMGGRYLIPFSAERRSSRSPAVEP